MRKRVDLRARVAKARDAHDGVGTETEQGVTRQGEQVDAGGQDVLTEVARAYVVPVPPRLVEELRGQQVHLPQVRLGRVGGHPGAVLHGGARMCVALDTVALHQDDLLLRELAEPVLPVLGQAHDHPLPVRMH